VKRLPHFNHVPSSTAGTALVALALCLVPIDLGLAVYGQIHSEVIVTYVRDGAEQDIRGMPQWFCGVRLAIPTLGLAVLVLSGRIKPADAGITLGDLRITLFWLALCAFLFVGGLLLYVGASVIISRLGLASPDSWMVYPGPWAEVSVWKTALIVCVMYPAMEEVLYRGIYLPALESTGGPRFAVFVSVTTWFALHLVYCYELNVGFVIFYSLSGALLTFAMLRTRSLVTPMVLHAFMNMISQLVMPWLIVNYHDFIWDMFNLQR
jgi:membrane protease YdiL (CAAX protease family)